MCLSCILLTTGGRYGVTLWRTDPERAELEVRAELNPKGLGAGGVVRAALWREGSVAATLDDRFLRSWRLAEGRAEVRHAGITFRHPRKHVQNRARQASTSDDTHMRGWRLGEVHTEVS